MCAENSNCRNGLVFNESTGECDPCGACNTGGGNGHGGESAEEHRGNGSKYDGPSR